MQFNQATDYAFRVVLHLAGLPPGSIVNGQALAQAEYIPHRFLQKIMRSLLQADIIRSYRGVEGGFSLNRPAEELSLYDVVTAMEGPIEINHCLQPDQSCTRRYKEQCPVHTELYRIQKRLIADLQGVTFRDLAAKAVRPEEKPSVIPGSMVPENRQEGFM